MGRLGPQAPRQRRAQRGAAERSSTQTGTELLRRRTDQVMLALLGEPALVLQDLEHAGHRLARGADHVGDLLVREARRDAPAVRRGALAGEALQQSLGALAHALEG